MPRQCTAKPPVKPCRLERRNGPNVQAGFRPRTNAFKVEINLDAFLTQPFELLDIGGGTLPALCPRAGGASGDPPLRRVAASLIHPTARRVPSRRAVALFGVRVRAAQAAQRGADADREVSELRRVAQPKRVVASTQLQHGAERAPNHDRQHRDAEQRARAAQASSDRSLDRASIGRSKHQAARARERKRCIEPGQDVPERLR